ncbi:ATP-binding cassette domain-containing protein [Lactococcus hircilactis]|uniref:ATP-binding cassette domain-containing protein n=1 Tax=Lactococcus hircilactis TaxID=1494462 RepID=A0A7X2D0Q4_9LACT|nr:ATP-binding cassette domain-containing protein [Lactococcus hircilactis]MQW38692.1 ATP-binding cassette domain-containing protein [Lactococcus hircilactis]
MKIENLSKSFGKKKILKNISLTIPKGKLTAFIGPNGAGKSTLLSCMSRLTSYDQGKISLDGKTLDQFKTDILAQKLAILKQMNQLNMQISVQELVAFGRFPYSKGHLTPTDLELIQNAMNHLGLAEIANENIQNLSGGQIQRAYIAMILAQDTDYILLDEPLNNLDMNFALQMMQLLQDLVRKHGKTVVIVLHDLNFASSFADEIVAMKSGEIFMQSKTDDLIRTDVLASLYGMTIRIQEIDGKKFCLYF